MARDCRKNEVYCETWTGIFDENCYAIMCKRRPAKEAIEILHGNVIGQNLALNNIEKALLQDEMDGKSKTFPIIFHFIGQNGVGKTLTGNLHLI